MARSIGIAPPDPWPSHEANPVVTLLRDATRRSPSERTIPTMSSLSGDVVREALDELIEHGPLSVVFQPIADLARGTVLGYEVLGRCGPVPGPLADAIAGGPSSLLDLAHSHGCLLALDRRWRTLAIDEISGANVPMDTKWFINVDPRVGDAPGITPGFTEALVRRHALDPARFVLELTESVTRDPSAIERVLAHYARQGFRVALDDLGADQQSLATLLRIQPSIVKLDAVLARGVEVDRSRMQLLSALAEFGRRTGTTVIAEGIESAAQLAAVTCAGIAGAQGFYVGRPAPRPQPLAVAIEPVVPTAMAQPSAPDALILELIDRLRSASGALEAMLQSVTDAASTLLGGARTSLRLLDESRTRLLVAARTGTALHGADQEFRVGEGLAGWVVARGEPVCVGDAEADPRFVAKPGQRGHVGAFVGVPLLDAEGAIGVLAASSTYGPFATPQVSWLRVVAGVATPYLDIARLNRIALTDELTLALNRRALDALIPHASTAPDAPVLSVALFDIDHFKVINDRLGHAAGDDVLRTVPQLLATMLRREDAIVRLGGDEFLLVLRGVTAEAAQQIAARACAAVAAAAILSEPVTLSAGVAERAPGEPRNALLERADRALYRAKAEGRSRANLAR